jgi:DNA-binding NarL/FixJ family response regulator
MSSSSKRAQRSRAPVESSESGLGPIELSAAERAVLEGVRLGRTTKELALKLRIPERTVELHIRHSLGRLRARSRSELLALVKIHH